MRYTEAKQRKGNLKKRYEKMGCMLGGVGGTEEVLRGPSERCEGADCGTEGRREGCEGVMAE